MAPDFNKPQRPEIPLPRGQAVPAPHAAPITRPAWWKFFGPAFIISIGYFDPGNWATDLQAGSQFGYALLWVLSLSCLIGALVQNLCARLGIATGRDLAQHCRDRYPRPVAYVLFVSAVISMMATDLAEIIGVAVALHLLFGIPPVVGALITVVDVFLILLLNNWSFRAIEAAFLVVLTTVSGLYVAEMIMSRPDFGLVAYDSLVPNGAIVADAGALFIAIGIVGATIMPHNLYLHSRLATTRLAEGLAPPATLYRWSVIDTNVSLFCAWVHQCGHPGRRRRGVPPDVPEDRRGGRQLRGRLQDAGADPEPGCGPHLRRRAPGLWHRVIDVGDARRPDRVRGLPRHRPLQPVPHPSRQPRAYDGAGSGRDPDARASGRHPGVEPGGAVAATAVRPRSAAPAHRRPQADGRVRDQCRAARDAVGGGRRADCAQRRHAGPSRRSHPRRLTCAGRAINEKAISRRRKDRVS